MSGGAADAALPASDVPTGATEHRGILTQNTQLERGRPWLD